MATHAHKPGEEKHMDMQRKLSEKEHPKGKNLLDVPTLLATHPDNESRLEHLCDQLKALKEDCLHCHNVKNTI